MSYYRQTVPAVWELHAETETIEVTRGPTINHPGDPWRMFAPGITTYTLVHHPTGRRWRIPSGEAATVADALTLGADPDLPDDWLLR